MKSLCQSILKRILYILLVIICLLGSISFSFAFKAKQGINYVNLFIGTANDQGQLDPSATVPYGMVKVGPDCTPASHVGYDFETLNISGFSINRTSGVGCSGAGGNLSVRPDYKKEKLSIVKSTEKAIPGYYSTELSNGTTVELTATNNVALEMYKFGINSPRVFDIDFSKSFAAFVDCHYEILSSAEISGWISAKNTCDNGLYKFYFYISSNEEFEIENKSKTDLVLVYSKKLSSIELRIGVSGINSDDAKKEVIKIGTLKFSEVSQQAFQLWANKLNQFELVGDEDNKTMFYSSLYRTYLSPVNVTSEDGAFINSQGEKEITTDYTYYSSWSLWDTYRTKFPFLTITDPQMMKHFCWSLCKLYKSGKAPWSTLYEVTPTTRTEHAPIVLLDAYSKGIEGIDFEECYEEIRAEVDSFELISPDNYLESAYDYWAVSQIAKILNKAHDYEKYSLLAENTWRKIWIEKFKDIDDNRFDIMHGDGLYEGTLWQYRWAVPFDIEGLSKIAGGDRVLKDQLAYFFENDLYNQGNQPDIQAVYIFNRINAPEMTQYWVNKILTKPMKHSYGTHKKFKQPYFDKAFKPVPRAYIPEMDDDDGTMAAWYVLSSIGIFPLRVGTPYYEITTPIFDKVTIQLANNKEFKIVCNRTSPNSIYIKQALLNGKVLDKMEINHIDIINGGILELVIE